MPEESNSPLDLEWGRRYLFTESIRELDAFEVQLEQVELEDDQRQDLLVSSARLKAKYRQAITDWSENSQRELSIAEELYGEAKAACYPKFDRNFPLRDEDPSELNDDDYT